jgi:hypothetical protein
MVREVLEKGKDILFEVTSTSFNLVVSFCAIAEVLKIDSTIHKE